MTPIIIPRPPREDSKPLTPEAARRLRALIEEDIARDVASKSAPAPAWMVVLLVAVVLAAAVALIAKLKA